jgi:sulfonate dioxygenase
MRHLRARRTKSGLLLKSLTDMAPFLEEPVSRTCLLPILKGKLSQAPIPSVPNYVPGRTAVETHETYEHEDLKPYFPDVKWPALEEVPYEDKGILGDSEYKNLKAIATSIVDYNPKIGTEVSGVDLANLTDAQKNDIARLIATRGVVFFRNQKNLTIEKQLELGAYLGKVHSHATTSVPKRGDLDNVHVVYTDENSKDQRALFTPSFLWHADVSFFARS